MFSKKKKKAEGFLDTIKTLVKTCENNHVKTCENNVKTCKNWMNLKFYLEKILFENSKLKIKEKYCDLIIANDVSKKDTGFNSDFNKFDYDNYNENLEVTEHYLNRAPKGTHLKKNALYSSHPIKKGISVLFDIIFDV